MKTRAFGFWNLVLGFWYLEFEQKRQRIRHRKKHIKTAEYAPSCQAMSASLPVLKSSLKPENAFFFPFRIQITFFLFSNCKFKLVFFLAEK